MRSPNAKFVLEQHRIGSKSSIHRLGVMLRHATRQNVERYRQKRRQQNQLFREKKRRQEEEEFEELEQLNHSHETRKFYQKLNASRTGFVPRAEMCRDKDGSILTDDREVTERWKQHFDEHLNGVQEEDQDPQR